MNNLITGLDKFNNVISDVFCPMSCKSLPGYSSNAFKGELSSRSFNKTAFSKISSGPIIANRTKEDISRVSDAYYLIKFQMEGQGIIRHNNREAKLDTGDFVICSSVEPYELEFAKTYKQTVLSIPQDTLQSMFHSPDDYLGVRMGNELPTHGILSQFVYSISQRMDILEPDSLQNMEANVLDLLITSLKAEQKLKLKTSEISETSPEIHLQQIKRFIDLHIKDYRLSVDFIAQAENISKRYLHMLFKGLDVSVSRYIQQLRLAGCYKDLRNKEFNLVSVSDIALDWGFGDVSHFYRCFKSQYQVTPRQIRLKAKV
ncbi:helix-turn-helix domain-containing protein [Pseudocolwellia sp. HL-MZ19]|uniref:AraC-like ligand-binding domain-containing protein n=1 Tax=Pseudocolwellia sp. HL-MZ19 TaxID=3400846 RepID=UPI003CF3E3F7